jgi:nucleoid DNA-binding protein
MYPMIHKYLLQHKKVSIPGIGHFTIETKPASIDHEQNILHAPQQYISFKSETALADRVFYNFLAKELHIEEIDAIKKFHEFTYQLKSDINNGDGVQFNGIGLLKKQPYGSFIFKAENALNNYFATILLPVFTNNIHDSPLQHLQLKNENFGDIELIPMDNAEAKSSYWWIYAILLAIAGIAAICYKYA